MLRSLRLVKISLSFGIALLLAPSAFADGVTDVRISPAATSTISTSGSYRLVGSVTMTANVAAINITAANVTLDLNGHAITGKSGSTTDGIVSTLDGITLSNGIVTAFGKSGVDLTGTRATVRNVQVVNCNINGGESALRVGETGTVEYCKVIKNSPASGSCIGISAGIQSRIIRNTVQKNSSLTDSVTGIFTQGGCEISNNLVSDNITSGSLTVLSGIQTDPMSSFSSSSVQNNTVTRNRAAGDNSSAYGISAYSCIVLNNLVSDNSISAITSGQLGGILAVQSTVTGNRCQANSADANGNGTAYGIFTGFSDVRDNSCSFNTGAGTGFSAGITCQGRTRIENNQCTSNTGGALSVGIYQNTNNDPTFAEGNLIAGNHTSHHTDAGIMFRANIGQRCHSNQCREVEVIESDLSGAVMPDSLPIPGSDTDNILY